jgi:hypothetical protein
MTGFLVGDAALGVPLLRIAPATSRTLRLIEK